MWAEERRYLDPMKGKEEKSPPPSGDVVGRLFPVYEESGQRAELLRPIWSSGARWTDGNYGRFWPFLKSLQKMFMSVIIQFLSEVISDSVQNIV